jgi:hypothetical protein
MKIIVKINEKSSIAFLDDFLKTEYSFIPFFEQECEDVIEYLFETEKDLQLIISHLDDVFH